MRVVFTLSGLMLLCASVATTAGTLMRPAHARVAVQTMSEPAGLVVLGVGFVILSNQVRRKKC